MRDSNPSCFIDSNIWLYAFIEGEDAFKLSKAQSLVKANNITVSTQVINEVCVNLVKKAKFTEPDVRSMIASFYNRYTVVSQDQAIFLKASKVREQHSFSFWDSLIFASAIFSGAKVLYSEDMQDGFEIEGVCIVNPFSY